MAQKKAHEVDSFIARPDKGVRIVLIYGPDKGLVSERAAAFATSMGLSPDDPFAVVRMDGPEIDSDPGRLADEARTISLFGGERLIWVRNAGSGKGLADAVKHLIAEPPADSRILIEAADLKKGAALRSAVEAGAGAMALPCYADDARSVDAVIDATLGEAKLGITLDARQALKDSLGGDRLATRAELEKLCLYARGQERVSLEDVREAIGDVAGLSTDEVVDAMLVGNLSGFNRAFDRVAKSGTPPFLMLATAARQFQTIQLLRHAMETERKNAAAAVAAARPPVFFSRRRLMEDALNRWSSAAADRALERLQRTVLESRQNAALAVPIIRQAMLALAVEAARGDRTRR